MYKYTAVAAVFRGVFSKNFHQTRTVFETLGAYFGHHEGHESNNLLQNRDVFRLSRHYFRLF